MMQNKVHNKKCQSIATFLDFKKLYDFFVRYTAIVFTVEQHTWNKKAKKMINSREKIMKIIETPQGCYGTFIREAISIKICLCILVIISSSFKAWNQNSTVIIIWNNCYEMFILDNEALFKILLIWKYFIIINVQFFQ